MIKLSRYEKAMLSGEYGELKRIALRNIIEYAKVLNAKELCEVSKAHLFCGDHSYLKACKSEDIEEVISEMHFCSKKKLPMDKFVCYCQSDCGPMDPVNYKEMGINEEKGLKNLKYLNHYKELGVNMIGSCVPYMLGFIPLKGEHYVSSESHAVVLMNSLWGACGNADGLEAGFWSAVCGRTPKWGNHIMENRKGTHVFEIRCEVKNSIDWDLLGYTIGRKLPTHSIPVIYGLEEYPDIFKIKYFFAALATTSGPEMCHIVGLTPEADTVEIAMGGKEPNEIKVVTREDLKESFNILNENNSKNIKKADYISLGCPHYSIEELRIIAEFYKNRKVHKGTAVHIWTAQQIKNTADTNGYTSIIEKAGARILTSSCPLTSEKIPDKSKKIVFDSAKQAHYIRPTTDADVYYLSLEKCLELSVEGEVEVTYE